MKPNDLELFDEDLALRMAMYSIQFLEKELTETASNLRLTIQFLEKELAESARNLRLSMENNNFVSKQRDEAVARSKEFIGNIIDLQKENHSLIEQNGGLWKLEERYAKLEKRFEVACDQIEELSTERAELSNKANRLPSLEEDILRSNRQISALRGELDAARQQRDNENTNNHRLMDELAREKRRCKFLENDVLKTELRFARRTLAEKEETAISRGEQLGVLNDEIRSLKARIDDLLKKSDMTSEKWEYVEMAIANGKLYRNVAVKMVMVITGMGITAAVKAWEAHYNEPYNPSLKKESPELDLNTMVSIMDGEI